MEGAALARIEHRRTPLGPAGTAPSIRGLPAVALVLLGLGIVVAVLELWPVVNAWWIGATQWWSELPLRLPSAARSGAMVMLPAAVAWGSPGTRRHNAWLWKGALILAAVQLLRYPADVASSFLFDLFAADEGSGAETAFVVVSLALSLPLAVGSIIGIWATGEGLKDAAGGRSRLAVVVALIVALVFALLLGIPYLMTVAQPDVDLATSLLSIALNVLFLFVAGVLAGRAVAGAFDGAVPTGGWRAGAIGAVVLWVLPILTLVTLLMGSLLLVDGNQPAIPHVGVATYFGWPLFAVALAMGMGRLAVRSPRGLGSGFNVRGTPRFVPATEMRTVSDRIARPSRA